MKYSSEYLGRLIFIAVGAVISIASLFYSNYIAKELASKERDEIQLWAKAVYAQNSPDPRNKGLLDMANRTISIPSITIDEFMQIVQLQQVDPSTVDTPEKLRLKLKEMASGGREPIPLELYNGTLLQVFYDESSLLKSLYWFPYIQILIITVFIGLIFITYSSTRDNEQNRIWVGMSKETAHQLGTPTSSLLGWVEFLKTLSIDPTIPDEIGKDVTRISKVVARFSKIGSQTKEYVPCNLFELTDSVVSYFKTRAPKNVIVSLDNYFDEPLQSLVNPTLIEWVIENLMKNALDAMNGKGTLTVKLSSSDKMVIVDVCDTGKGIPKQLWKRVFSTGFTTKTRGWGLGLSLSKRIITQYHHGKIYVLNSEINVGTTFRIELKRI